MRNRCKEEEEGGEGYEGRRGGEVNRG